MSHNAVTKLKKEKKKENALEKKPRKQWATINNLTHNGNKDH
jgi:hypothetical protein